MHVTVAIYTTLVSVHADSVTCYCDSNFDIKTGHYVSKGVFAHTVTELCSTLVAVALCGAVEMHMAVTSKMDAAKGIIILLISLPGVVV
jgi:hypothetical protein